MSATSHRPAVTTSVPIETFVALGAIDPELVEPFLAPHQRLVLNPGDEELAGAGPPILRAGSHGPPRCSTGGCLLTIHTPTSPPTIGATVWNSSWPQAISSRYMCH